MNKRNVKKFYGALWAPGMLSMKRLSFALGRLQFYEDNILKGSSMQRG